MEAGRRRNSGASEPAREPTKIAFGRSDNRPCSYSTDLGVQRITGSPHRTNEIKLTFAVERLPQSTNVDIDRPKLHIDILTPGGIEQFLTPENSPRVSHEVFQKTKLGWTEVEGTAIALHPMRLQVHGDVVEPQRLFVECVLERRSNARKRAESASMLKGFVI